MREKKFGKKEGDENLPAIKRQQEIYKSDREKQ